MTPSENALPGRLRSWVLPPLVAAGSLLLPGALAVLTGQLLLFASLGPSAVTVAQQPTQPTSKAYNVFVGHTVGLVAAFIAVWLLGLEKTPSIFELHEVSPVRVGAAVIALALAVLLELLLRAKHPPAASTTLLVALGSFHPTWHDAWVILAGVAAVTLSSEFLKRIFLTGATSAAAGE